MTATSWVTLATNDSYSLGALVLGHSLRNVGTIHQLTVLVTPGVTKPMRDRLSSVFNNIREVNVLDSRDKANLSLLARPDLGITFTKLHCWRLTEFSKAVFLDADTLVLKNSDELFEREEFSAAPDAGWPDCFNSGVFVFKPSEETYQSLLQFAVTHGSFDGGDQGLLNSYFADWSTKDISRHLPFIYNMVSSAFYSYLPALKQYGDKVKIVHFIGPCKPWLQYLDCETKKVRAPPGSEHLQPLLQLWWDIFCSRVHSSLTGDMKHRSSHAAPLSAHTDAPPARVTTDDTFSPNSTNQQNFNFSEINQDVSSDFVDPWETYDESHHMKLPDGEQNRESHSFDFSDNVHTAPVFVSPQADEQPTADLFPLEKDVPYAQGETVENTADIIVCDKGSEVTTSETMKRSLHMDEPLVQTGFVSSADSTPCEPVIPVCVLERSINSNTINESEFSCVTHMQKNSENIHLNDNQESDFSVCDNYNNCNDVMSSFLNIKQPLQVPEPLNAGQINTSHTDHSDTDSIENECDLVHIGASRDEMHELTETGLAGALAQLTLGVPRTAEQIALDEHLRRQAWEEGRFDYMGVDSFDNIWQKISETMAEKPESKDEHQVEVQAISHERHSTIVAHEPRGQISPVAVTAAVDFSQTSATAQIPSTDATSPSSASSPVATEPIPQKPAPVTSSIPGPEPSAMVPPVDTAVLSTGVVPEQKTLTYPAPLSEPTAQASVSLSKFPVVEGIKDPPAAVLPPSETLKALGEPLTPILSQTDLTQKESDQTLPSPTLTLSEVPSTMPITTELPTVPMQTTQETPLPPAVIDLTTEKPISTVISEQSPAAADSEITQLASQPPTTTVSAVSTIPSSIGPSIAASSPPPAAPPMDAPASVPAAPTLTSQTLTTPVHSVQEIPSSISPPTVTPLVDAVDSSPPSAAPPLIPAPVLPPPAAPVPQEQTDSKKSSEPLTQVAPVSAVTTVAAEPSEKAPVLAPSPLVAAPKSKPPEKPVAVATVPETSSVPDTPMSPTKTAHLPPPAATAVGIVPPLVPTAAVIGAQPTSPPAAVATSQKYLPSSSLPTPISASTIEKPPEPSTPSSVPTSPTDIQIRPVSTALVSVPKIKQKAPTRAPEPPKPPIPMPAPESPSALSSPMPSVGVPASCETKTVKAPTAPGHPKEPKTEVLTGQTPKKPDKQQDTTKLGKDKGNLEEIPVSQLTEADSKLSKKTKDTEPGTDSQAAPEKLPAKTSTKQAKQSKPKAPETPTKSETAAAKPTSPPATEPASPESEAAPPVTKVKTKVVKVPKGTKETVLKDVPQQDPVLKMVSPPLSSPAGSPPLSPDAGKLPAPKSEAPVEKGSTAEEKGTVVAETTEQASAAPVPPKRKGAKATASGEGSSKTQSKPTKTVPKPKK